MIIRIMNRVVFWLSRRVQVHETYHNWIQQTHSKISESSIAATCNYHIIPDNLYSSQIIVKWRFYLKGVSACRGWIWEWSICFPWTEFPTSKRRVLWPTKLSIPLTTVNNHPWRRKNKLVIIYPCNLIHTLNWCWVLHRKEKKREEEKKI